VVKDATSQSGDKPATPTNESGPQQAPEPTQHAAPPGNLTHELAQLLAASIASNQASRPGGSTPTNSELTSLANLVSASHGQRALAPVFKDGLSALSYTLPRPSPEAPAGPVLEPEPDEEPMPIPSTWRQSPARDDERWFRQQLGAALLGLVAGLMIVVPTVLWLSGWFEPPKGAGRPQTATAASVVKIPAEPKASEIRTVTVQVRPVDKPAEGAAQFIAGSVEPPRPVPAQPRQVAAPPPPPVEPVSTASAARLLDPIARLEELLTESARRIESGDVTGAREILAGADDGSQGAVLFALAETYDPNMLAAWGSRGVAADVPRARALYRRAVGLGVARAQARLEGLQ
jgi:hypothetical protein